MAPTRRARIRPFFVVLALHVSLGAQYDPKAVEPIPRLKGTFFVGGGGTLPEEIFDRFVQMAGGETAKIVILSTAKIEDAVRTPFTKRKAKSLDGIHADSKEAAGAADLGAPIGKATGVWIVGDRGSKFAEVFRGTPIETALREVIARGGVIGGNGDITRALTKVMIESGQSKAVIGTGLDLIPGAVIDDHYSTKSRRARLLGVLAARPSLVGLGVDEKTAMVLHQRFIDVLGEGSVYGCVSASPKRKLRVDRMNRQESPASQRRTQRSGGGKQRSRRRSGRRRGVATSRTFRPDRLGDLIALSRSAHARVARNFPAWSPKTPNVTKGTLIIIGGGGMARGLMDHFIELAGGKEKARLVYVPCSEAEKIDQEPRIVRSWRQTGVKSADWIHTKDRNAANTDKKILDTLRNATGIFFGGGRQWNLVDSYQNTIAHKLMHDVLARDGVIGGSSAGASIQASYMVRGNSLGNLDPMAEGYETGLGFLTGVAVDQHFSQRGRLPDMTSLVKTYPELLGIGLDEASSIVVQGTIARAFSRKGRKVHIYDRTKPVVSGKPDYIVLEHGQSYDLKNRRMVEAAGKKSGKQQVGAKK